MGKVWEWDVERGNSLGLGCGSREKFGTRFFGTFFVILQLKHILAVFLLFLQTENVVGKVEVDVLAMGFLQIRHQRLKRHVACQKILIIIIIIILNVTHSQSGLPEPRATPETTSLKATLENLVS